MWVWDALQKAYAADELYEFGDKMGQKFLDDCLRLCRQRNGFDRGRIWGRFGPRGCDFVSWDGQAAVLGAAQQDSYTFAAGGTGNRANGKASGKVGAYCSPAPPDAFHRFNLMIRSYSKTYFCPIS